MKLSMMSYTMSRQPEFFDLKEMLKLTEALDLDGIDFVTLHGMTAKELKKISDDHGVTVVAHTFATDLNFPDASGRAEGVDTAKRGIEAAVELEAPLVMIPTPAKEGIDRDVSRYNWIEGLKEVQPFAEDAGLILTVENFPFAGSPFVIADDMLDAVHEVPGLRITYDNGNAAGGEDPAESFKQCAEYVVHAHFKDWEEATAEEGKSMLNGEFWKSALIGEGMIDQKSCMEAMMAADYDGCINIEYEGNKYKPDDAIRKAVTYLRDLAETLESG